jgi:hypothetical protein
MFGPLEWPERRRRSAAGEPKGRTKIPVLEEFEMSKQVAVVLYAVAMVAAIIGVDLVFFRNRFWERLTVNIGIVLVFAAFYWRFFKRP